MMRVLTALAAVAAVTFLAAPATADWDVGDPHKMHFPQLPDVENGMNILATSPKVLADDFRCSQSGYITDIHIWGSWLYDEYPWDTADPNSGPDPKNVSFLLSLHNDIPAADSPTGYSIPEQDPIWERNFGSGEFGVRHWAESLEDFFDPNQNEILGQDNNIWQYNFYIPAADAQWQEEGKIYWLNVTAFPGPFDPAVPDQPALFGWKTSIDHWNDDAVYWDQDASGAIMWPPGELRDLRTGESLDLAFVITPEPGTVVMLLGAGLVGLMAYARRRRKH